MKHTYCETCGHCEQCNPHPAANKETEKTCSRCGPCEYSIDRLRMYREDYESGE